MDARYFYAFIALTFGFTGCKPRTKDSEVAAATALANPNRAGTLILGGGGLSDPKIYARVLALAKAHSGQEKPKLAIFLTGFMSAKGAQLSFNQYHHDEHGEVQRMPLAEEFAQMGFTPVLIPLNIDTYAGRSYFADVPFSDVANSDSWAKEVRSAAAIYFEGGDQARYFRSLKNDNGSDSKSLQAIREVYQSGGVMMGSSAGAMVLGEFMYGVGTSWGYIRKNRLRRLDLFKDQLCKVQYDRNPAHIDKYLKVGSDGYLVDIETGERSTSAPALEDPKAVDNLSGSVGYGINFLQDTVVETHFDGRGRLGRMVVAASQANMKTGGKVSMAIGIDVDTTLVYNSRTQEAEVVGTQGVFIADLRQADMGVTASGAFRAKDVRISYLSNGDKINLRLDKEFTVTSSKAGKTGKNPFSLASNAINPPTTDFFSEMATTQYLYNLIKSDTDRIAGKVKNLFGTTDTEPAYTVQVRKIKDVTKGYIDGESFSVQDVFLDIN